MPAKGYTNPTGNLDLPRTSIKETILLKCSETPSTWTTLLQTTKISKPTLYQHLHRLEAKGQVVKNRHTGLYEITDEGRDYLEIQKITRVLKGKWLRVPIDDYETFKEVSRLTGIPLWKITTQALRASISAIR